MGICPAHHPCQDPLLTPHGRNLEHHCILDCGPCTRSQQVNQTTPGQLHDCSNLLYLYHGLLSSMYPLGLLFFPHVYNPDASVSCCCSLHLCFCNLTWVMSIHQLLEFLQHASHACCGTLVMMRKEATHEAVDCILAASSPGGFRKQSWHTADASPVAGSSPTCCSSSSFTAWA